MTALICRFQLIVIAIAYWCFCLLPSVVEAANLTDLTIGKNIYNQGIRPSGEELTAIVAGDVPFLGTQFSCQSCHGRSGMGGIEGEYIVPPVAGQILYLPSPQTKRPAYNRESLATVLRTGVDSTGRLLDPIMPRFNLTDNEIDALAVYMEGMLTGQSPGLDDKIIHLATVITDDVAKDKRKAVLDVLDTFIDNKNSQTRLESERYNRGLTPSSKLPTLYRKWQHHIWTLTGPRISWPAQLEKYYENSPVFAMLGGLSTGSWKPIGRFCEEKQIPCLFPSTDMPESEKHDYYTRYFSRGLELEADLIASHFVTSAVPSNVIQVYCTSMFSSMIENLKTSLSQKNVRVDDLVFNCDKSFPASELKLRLDEFPDSVVILWLKRNNLLELDNALATSKRIYLSSTLLDLNLQNLTLPPQIPTFVAHPYRLPDKSDIPFKRFKLWAKTRGIKIRYPRLQAEAFFACFATRDALKHIRRYRLREYAIEMLDHSQSLPNYVPFHSQPSMGPKQRFLTKGGFLLSLINGKPANNEAIWLQP